MSKLTWEKVCNDYYRVLFSGGQIGILHLHIESDSVDFCLELPKDFTLSHSDFGEFVDFLTVVDYSLKKGKSNG